MMCVCLVLFWVVMKLVVNVGLSIFDFVDYRVLVD